MPHDLLDRLRRIHLNLVKSTGVRMVGYDPEARMVAVVFPDGETVYGYPNLSDDEVRELLEALQGRRSLGKTISTLIKPNHDFERVTLEKD